MMRLIAVASVALALCGCAHGKIVRFDGGEVSPPHAEQTAAICQGEMTHGTIYQGSVLAGESLAGGIIMARQRDALYRACMAKHGYRITDGGGS